MPDEQQAPALDQKKLNRMKIGILQLERSNLNTREKTNDEMVDYIRKTIMSIVNKGC